MQVISILLLVLLGFAMMANVATEFVAPAFYKGLEGPKFTVVKKLADNIELRSYEPCACQARHNLLIDKWRGSRVVYVMMLAFSAVRSKLGVHQAGGHGN